MNINQNLYYYVESYDDYFRVMKKDESSDYPYLIDWYFKEVEPFNNVKEDWFELMISEKPTTEDVLKKMDRTINEWE